MELNASAKKSLPISVNEKVLEYASDSAKGEYVVAFVPATKPCFYKMWSLIEAAEKKGLPYFVMHAGQHYDELLGHGMKEFGLEEKVGVNLGIRGGLSEKSAELFLKMKSFSEYMEKKFPKVKIVPFVNGDTLTAGVLPAAWMFATNNKCVQGEAGLRGMAPSGFRELKGGEGIDDLKIMQQGVWEIARDEPFPEQWGTYVSGAGCEYHFAPVELNKKHLVKEGNAGENVFVVGNTVVDAIGMKRKEKKEESVFDEYPKLEEGEWLRVDIHRRGNLTERRFKAIVGGIEKLVKGGKKIAFIELNATRTALEKYGLRERLVKLSEKGNFLFTPIWKEYRQVIEFLESGHCTGIYTDSGSMQEEMNELGKACLTARFNTDRPETVMNAGSNLLVPPFNEDFVFRNVSAVLEDSALRRKMGSAHKLYGTGVGEKTINKLRDLKLEGGVFSWSHERLGLWREKGKITGYL